MAAHRYNTRNVCSKQIRFAIEDGKVRKVQFLGGGCSSNLQAISTLVEGLDAKQAADMLRDNVCGKRGTSCVGQLAHAIDLALSKEASEG